jgi:hypothetical protein
VDGHSSLEPSNHCRNPKLLLNTRHESHDGWIYPAAARRRIGRIEIKEVSYDESAVRMETVQ